MRSGGGNEQCKAPSLLRPPPAPGLWIAEEHLGTDERIIKENVTVLWPTLQLQSAMHSFKALFNLMKTPNS